MVAGKILAEPFTGSADGFLVVVGGLAVLLSLAYAFGWVIDHVS